MFPSGCYLIEQIFYFRFMVITSSAENKIYNEVHLHLSGAPAVPLQTRSLPVSTGFSKQRVITHNNINSHSSDTQNVPLVLIRSQVCLPGCLHLEVDIWLCLSVSSCGFPISPSVCLPILSLFVSMLILSFLTTKLKSKDVLLTRANP